MMPEKKLLDKLLDRLNKEDFLRKFRLVEKLSFPALVSGDRTGSHYAILRHFSKDGVLSIEPEYCCRYDIIHHWFEPFSTLSLQEQRDRSSISFTGGSNETQRRFYFKIGETISEDEYQAMKSVVLQNCRKVFNTFRGIYQVGGYQLLRVLDEGVNLPAGSGDWIFERAALALCVSDEDEYYLPFKQRLLDHVESLRRMNYSDPHFLTYRDRFNEIFDYLESYDFTKELNDYLEYDERNDSKRY